MAIWLSMANIGGRNVMKQQNQEILHALCEEKTGDSTECLKYSKDIKYVIRRTSYNGNLCREKLKEWDTEDVFPEEQIQSCIRMGEWLLDDFSIRNELNIKKVLPPYMTKVFFFMKDYSDKKDQTLEKTVQAYIKMTGLSVDNPEDLGRAVYEYAILKYKE